MSYTRRPRLKNRHNVGSDKKAEPRRGPTPEDREKGEDHLNHRQRLFVSEYATSLNATDAATRAGYSKSTACTIGSRLLRNVHIQKAVQKLQAKRLSRADITAERVLTELASVGFSGTDPELPKASEKIQALGLLAKHLGLLVDRHEVDTRTSILSVNVSAKDLEDARQLVEQSMKRSGGTTPLIEHDDTKVEGKGPK